MPVTRRQLLSVAVVGSLPLAGCTGGGGGSGGGGGGGGGNIKETSKVSMTGSQFEPRNIHVDTGTTVTWTNDVGHEHTVTSASDNWNFDKRVAGGESVDHSFEKRGVYDVYCTIHGSADLSGMSMKVGVGDATIQNPLGGGNGGNGQDGGGAY